jgi:hypothetical protein
MTDLHRHLLEFQSQVNSCEQLRRLLNGWDRRIAIVATDGEAFRLAFAATHLREVTPGPCEDADIHLSAPAGVLADVFSGRENPASLFLDGRLQVLASDKDQVKLDAVALILWD